MRFKVSARTEKAFYFITLNLFPSISPALLQLTFISALLFTHLLSQRLICLFFHFCLILLLFRHLIEVCVSKRRSFAADISVPGVTNGRQRGNIYTLQ